MPFLGFFLSCYSSEISELQLIGSSAKTKKDITSEVEVNKDEGEKDKERQIR